MAAYILCELRESVRECTGQMDFVFRNAVLRVRRVHAQYILHSLRPSYLLLLLLLNFPPSMAMASSVPLSAPPPVQRQSAELGFAATLMPCWSRSSCRKINLPCVPGFGA